MTIEDAKRKVDEIIRSSGTTHPKISVVQLAGIVKYLIGALDRIKMPKTTVLSTLPYDKVEIDPQNQLNRTPPLTPDRKRYFDQPNKDGKEENPLPPIPPETE